MRAKQFVLVNKDNGFDLYARGEPGMVTSYRSLARCYTYAEDNPHIAAVAARAATGRQWQAVPVYSELDYAYAIHNLSDFLDMPDAPHAALLADIQTAQRFIAGEFSDWPATLALHDFMEQM